MSSTKKTVSNKVSKSNISITYHFTSSDIEDQFDNKEMGIIIQVNNTKYIDKPSNPRQILNEPTS